VKSDGKPEAYRYVLRQSRVQVEAEPIFVTGIASLRRVARASRP
jgi:hypothetical protein